MIAHIDLGPYAMTRSRRLYALVKSGSITLGGYSRKKIYGTLKCSAGKRMNLNNRVFFKDEAEATYEGYRPCARCMREACDSWKARQK